MNDDLQILMDSFDTDDPCNALWRYTASLHRTNDFAYESMNIIPQCDVHEMLYRIKNSNFKNFNKNSKIAVLNVEFAIELWRIGFTNVTFITPKNCNHSKTIIERVLGYKYREMTSRLLKTHFDAVIGCPPSNERRIGRVKPVQIWHQIVELCHFMVNDHGILALMHNRLWRGCGTPNLSGVVSLRKIIKEMDMSWLSIRENMDMYVARKSHTAGFVTEIHDENNEVSHMCIHNMHVIPNSNIEVLHNLMASSNDEIVDVMFSTSKYNGTTGDNMRDDMDNEFCNPCIWTYGRNDKLRLKYSNIVDGHFGVSKLIFGIWNKKWIHMDIDGKYGVCHRAAAIVDDPDNLKQIEKVMTNPDFKKMMESARFTTEKGWNHNVIKLFKKDFWKEFI